ncbi:serine hydrolase domain-containing protein [Aspergillus lucknowensis]|uniref:Beta-lactamase/transpeptidase-like protein n=1 Tax=Aspergillus lucknowensis TaxID=176173 RepID=A0ABR4LMV9_9EURO
MDDSQKRETQQRLQSCLPQIHEIHSICQTPSITFGVVHNGEVIFKHSIGHRDAQQTLPANDETIYMIGSCSKMFTSAAVGILVDEGKLSWTDPIRKYVPEFDPVDDPRIGQEADIIDCLRHSTGLSPPSMLCLGPGGTILTDEEDLIPLLNVMPAVDGEGKERFNREWIYNNYVVGLVALIVQRVSGQRFADFVRGRILDPLGMRRTAVRRSDLGGDGNVAAPCVKKSNGRFHGLSDESWPCEEYTPLLAATGMRSCLNDMLTWCIAVLDAERSENDSSYQSQVPNNPLKQMTRVRRGYWTRPADDPEFSKDAAYGMGWFRADIPSSMLSAFSGNGFSREKEYRLHLQHILGKGSEAAPFQVVGHTGGMRGSIFSVFTFPETQSAIVTMTNGRDFGDASDFTAQLLIQALFDMKPTLDLASWARTEAQLAGSNYQKHIERPWRENRHLGDLERDPLLYVGDYRSFNGRFTLSIGGVADGWSTNLSVKFNHRNASECPLVFYRKDVYSFYQVDEDKWKIQQIGAREYKQMLLKFQVDEGGNSVEGLWWQWDADTKPAWFENVRNRNSTQKGAPFLVKSYSG